MHQQTAPELDFSAIFDHLPCAMMIARPDGSLIYANRSALKAIGLSQTEVAGSDWLAHVHPDDLAHVTSLWAAALRTGTPCRIDHRIRLANGTYGWVATDGAPVRNAKGEIVAWVGTRTDIDDRERVRAALTESEARFREYAAIASDWLWETGPDLIFTYVSPRAQDFTGAAAAELLGKRYDEGAIIGDDPEMARAHAEHLADLKARRRFRNYTFARRRRDGSRLYVKLSGNPIFDVAGKFLGYRGIATDATAEVLARRRANAAHTRLVDAIEVLPASFMLFDKDERLVLANDRVRKTFPAAAHLFVPGTSFAALARFGAEHQVFLGLGATAEATFLARLAQFRRGDTDEMVQSGDGRWFRLLERRTSDGGLVHIRVDITELKHAEDELRQAKRQSDESLAVLETLQSSAPVGFSLIDSSFRYRRINDALAANGGASAAEHIGHTVAEMRPYMWPRLEPVLRRVMATGKPVIGLEWTRDPREPAGAMHDAMSSYFPVRVKDELIGVGVVVTDVSELKRTQHELMDARRKSDEALAVLEALGTSAPVGIAFLDKKMRYERVNEAMAALSGMPAKDHIGRRMAEMLSAHWPGLEPALETMRHTGEPVTNIELSGGVSTLPNERRYWLATLYPVRTGDEIIGIGMSATEITERKRLEEQLLQAQKAEAIGQLTGGIAHDFNNLLGVVSGNLEFLTERLVDRPDLLELARISLDAVDRGATLTRSLLAFARRQPLSPVPLDANLLVRETTELLKRTLGETINIKVIYAPGLWQCEADPGQLQNALLNLAINSRDAMPDGGRLTIETANVRLDDEYARVNAEVAPGAYVMLGVSDTGVGMTPEVAAKAFDPFFTTKGATKGSGLGLSMVHGFASQSGGHVKIDSEPGHGSSIKLYLPRCEDRPSAELRQRADQTPASSAAILVVEDDADMRRLTVRQLRSLGYEPLEASRAAEAMKVISTNPQIALLLTDIVLPDGVNGRALAEMAVRARPGLRVLYMSGYSENAILHHGRLDPGVQLLQKPFRKKDLAAKVAAALATARGEP